MMISVISFRQYSIVLRTKSVGSADHDCPYWPCIFTKHFIDSGYTLKPWKTVLRENSEMRFTRAMRGGFSYVKCSTNECKLRITSVHPSKRFPFGLAHVRLSNH